MGEAKCSIVGTNLLGHVNCPDASPAANVEDAGLHMWLDGHRGLVQLASPCHGKKLVVNVHAVLFWLWSSSVSAEGANDSRLPTSSHGYM